MFFYKLDASAKNILFYFKSQCTETEIGKKWGYSNNFYKLWPKYSFRCLPTWLGLIWLLQMLFTTLRDHVRAFHCNVLHFSRIKNLRTNYFSSWFSFNNMHDLHIVKVSESNKLQLLHNVLQIIQFLQNEFFFVFAKLLMQLLWAKTCWRNSCL